MTERQPAVTVFSFASAFSVVVVARGPPSVAVPLARAPPDAPPAKVPPAAPPATVLPPVPPATDACATPPQAVPRESLPRLSPFPCRRRYAARQRPPLAC